MADLALQLTSQSGTATCLVSRLAVAAIGSARQPVPQLAWQLGSVDLRSRLAKQSRGVDHRRIAIQRKRKVQIVTKVVNSGALKGLFWRNRTL